MIDFDRDAFIDTFRDEANEHLQQIMSGLLELEKNSDNLEIINDLFRHAHSIKGSAALMNYNDMSTAAHKMEDLFGELRQQSRVADSVTIDILLKYYDNLKGMVEQIVSPGESVAESKTEPKDAEQKVVEPEPVKDIPLSRQPASEQQAGTTDENLINPKTTIITDSEAPSVVPVTDGQPQTNVDQASSGKESETIRVAVSKLDALLNLAGELVVNKLSFEPSIKDIALLQENINRLFLSITYIREFIGERDLSLSQEKYDNASLYLQEMENIILKMKDRSFDIYENFKESTSHLELVSENLQERIMAARMLPISTIFTFFQRAVRDLARKRGKKIELILKGEDVELDKKIIENVREPILHLLRNSIDHGIESTKKRVKAGKDPVGVIIVEVSTQGGHCLITIEDDGNGIDENVIKKTILNRRLLPKETLNELSSQEVLNYIFHPGFSTKEIITDISGRGVGMDVVRKNIEQLKGLVFLETKPGVGTKFSLKLPLTLTILKALLVRVRGEIFCIPLSLIEESIRISGNEVQRSENSLAFRLREKIIPLVELGDLLDLPRTGGVEKTEKMPVIIVGTAEERVGFIVDRLISKREIVSKPLSVNLDHVRNISGATILSDGRVSLILNIASLLNGVRTYHSRHVVGDMADSKVKEVSSPKKILVVDDTLITRQLEKNILESAGYEVTVATDGLEGLAKLRSQKFDLVVTDIEMPNLNGLELTSSIRSNPAYEGIPVIIVTSVTDESVKARGVEVGADAYVVKSDFEQKNLLETIGLLIGDS